MPTRYNTCGKKITRRRGTAGKGASRFKPRIRYLIYKAFEAGINSQSRIAEIVGIDQSVLSQWMDKGKDKKKFPAHYAFRQRIMRIQARRETEMLRCIEKCAVGGYEVKETQVKISPKGKEIKRRTRQAAPAWQAAAWRLERWLPDDYGLKAPNPMGDDSPEDLAQEIQRAAAALDSSVPDMFEEEGDD
jgi:hypothetical protein